MSFDELKRHSYEANMKLREYGLVMFTWGNASQICPERKYVAIKPSGVRYEDMTPDHMCVLRLSDGSLVSGENGMPNPSTDARTHLELYRRFDEVGGVVHTHSAYATSFAQAAQNIPCYGTTHADYFYGKIPCTRALTAEEINGDYELNTGIVIADTFHDRLIDPLKVPGVLISGHGPFTWGKNAADAAANAVYLEETARLAYMTRVLAATHYTERFDAYLIEPVEQTLLDKHYNRKHGKDAYYGQ